MTTRATTKEKKEMDLLCETCRRDCKCTSRGKPQSEAKIESCRGRSNQVFCNDPLCGRRDGDGKHYPMGHPLNKLQPEAGRESDTRY